MNGFMKYAWKWTYSEVIEVQLQVSPARTSFLVSSEILSDVLVAFCQ